MKALTVILAAAGATLAGAAIAILYAPRKGSETRSQLMQFVKENCPSGICNFQEKGERSSRSTKTSGAADATESTSTAGSAETSNKGTTNTQGSAK